MAGALAVGVGHLLSTTRWYWATIAAFVVISNTASTGATLRKAWQRLAGTVAGAMLGLLVGSVLSGETGVELALLLVSVFCAFYAFQTAYSVMVFFITLALSLLYALLGELSPQLLLLRVEQRAVGAAAGGLVALVVLPTPTHVAVSRAVSCMLDELARLVGDASDQLAGRDGQALDLAGQARAVDQAFQRLRDTARPLLSGLPGGRSPQLRRELLTSQPAPTTPATSQRQRPYRRLNRSQAGRPKPAIGSAAISRRSAHGCTTNPAPACNPPSCASATRPETMRT